MAKQRIDVVAKRRTRPAQPQLQAPHLSDAEIDRIRAGEHPRALLTMERAAIYLDFNPPRAAEKALHYLQRNHVRLLRRGRAYVVRQGSIDRLLETGQGDLDVQAAEQVAQLDQRRPAALGAR